MENASQPYGRTRGRTAEMLRKAIDEAKPRLSDRKVAEACGVSLKSLRLVLSGKNIPHMATVAELSALLRKPVEQIVDLEEIRTRRREELETRSRSNVTARRPK